jgi:Ca-activated chloride channel family protein
MTGQFQQDPLLAAIKPRAVDGNKAADSGDTYYLGSGGSASSGSTAIGVGAKGKEPAPGPFAARKINGAGMGSRGSAADAKKRSDAPAPGAGPSSPGPSGPSTAGGGSAPASTPPLLRERSERERAIFGWDSGGAAPAEKEAKLEELVVGRVAHGDEEVALQLLEDAADDRDELDQVRRYYWQLPVAEQQAYLDRQCRRILDGCRRMPNERPRDMFFRFWGDNPFEVAALDRLSTFSADVDTASYALARRYLNEGHVPEKAQIRTEEFVNWFKSDVPAPTSGVFAIHTDLTPSRFSTDTTRQMMRIVVRGKDLSKVERQPLNLTFVVDVSGSMREQNRLEMVKHAIRLLVTQLDPYDKIAIVKFSNDASTVLPLTSVAERTKIESMIEPLQPEGSTNSNAGLQLGYAIALGGIDGNATNRVVFLSDGVANVGETDPAKIAEQVKPMREKGIYLNTIGVGMNNHNDVLLEQLADKADGMCNYIDSPDEAKRQLVDNFTGAFQPIARDVKIQVEFDPAQVLRYRLLGYENRAIADADFRNDKVDAGELGAGHQVTALYEIERQAASSGDGALATVRVRWKEPRNFGKSIEQDAATEIAQTVTAGQVKTFEEAGQGYRRAVIAAQFAEILRRSIHARGDSLDALLVEALRLQKEIPNDADFGELCLLISKSKDLILRTMPACDELCQAIDQVREASYRRAQLEQLQREMDAKTLEDLKRQNDILEARLRELVKRRLETQTK